MQYLEKSKTMINIIHDFYQHCKMLGDKKWMELDYCIPDNLLNCTTLINKKGKIVLNLFHSQKTTRNVVEGRNFLIVLIWFSILLEGYKANLNFLETRILYNFEGLFSRFMKQDLFVKNLNTLLGRDKIIFEKILAKYGLKINENINKENYISFQFFNGYIDEWRFSFAENIKNIFNESFFNQHDLIFNTPFLKDMDNAFKDFSFGKKIIFRHPLNLLESMKCAFQNCQCQLLELDLSNNTKVYDMEYCFNGFNRTLGMGIYTYGNYNKAIDNVKLPLQRKEDLNLYHFISSEALSEIHELDFSDNKVILNFLKSFNKNEFMSFYGFLNEQLFVLHDLDVKKSLTNIGFVFDLNKIVDNLTLNVWDVETKILITKRFVKHYFHSLKEDEKWFSECYLDKNKFNKCLEIIRKLVNENRKHKEIEENKEMFIHANLLVDEKLTDNSILLL